MSTNPPPATTPAVPPAAGGPTPNEEEKNLAMLSHAGGILTFFVAPLIIWKLKGKDSAFVEEHAKEAMNFELTLMIGDIVALLVMVAINPYLGLLVWAPVLIARVGLGIMGTMAAMQGQPFRYVVNARLIK